MNILDMIKNEKVEWKSVWEVTIWDKKFNSVENYKQTNVDKYKYYLAKDVEKLIVENGDIKILTTNISEKYTNIELVENDIIDSEVICIPWGGNPVVQYYKGKFITTDNRIARSNNRNYLNTKYLYYYFLEKLELIKSFYRGSGIKHPEMKKILDLRIPIPSIEIQEKIVKTLDKFTKYVTELQAELHSREKQYEFYREKLLSEQYIMKYILEYKKVSISEICKRQKGINITASEMKEKNDENGDIKVFAAGNTVSKINGKNIENIIKVPSVIVKSRGNIDFEYYDKPFTHKNELWSYSSIDEQVLNIRYLYHYLKNNILFFRDNAITGKLPQISVGLTDNFKILLPSIKIQEKIVYVLDNFEKVCKDLNIGLPKEIELRQKQYEYFRKKLLTFEKESPTITSGAIAEL